LNLRLEEQVVAVVGAAQGIGKAIAAAFMDEGARVALIDRNPAVIEMASSWARHAGTAVCGLIADVADNDTLRQAAREAEAALGPCAHLIYAAGAGSGKFGFPFWNLEPSDWPRVLSVNLLGAVHAAHAFTPSMVENRYGSVLFLASVAGQIGSQTDPPYSAAKAGVINFAQCAAKDLAPYNVRVNTLCPGMVKTELNHSVWQAWNDRQTPDARIAYEPWAAEKIHAVTPLDRWQDPEDMAAMAVFLASDLAKNITGQTINVDGGQVMHW
jgi:2-hydroxycyclohexanecarboxyl-CoA dehydrogenase